jgi:flavin reductase (DIM6/NTAB) family NADH-FMN oxidoreductase RutF
VSDASKEFSKLVGQLDYPMLIVTTRAGEELGGCLIGFSTQCSIDPARFLICLSNKNRTYRLLDRATAVAVHFIPSDDIEIARLFGSETGDETDKFSRCRWHSGPEEMPILEECPRWFVGRILERHVLGDHDAVVLEPVGVSEEREGDSLGFEQAKTLDPGHEA